MTILLTGATKVQLDMVKVRRRVQIGMIPSLMYEQLKTFGEVERRPVEIGEDLSKYEGVVVCLSPLSSLKAQYGLGMTWAMLDAYRRGIPLVVHFDDWQTLLFFNSFRALARHKEKAILKVVGGSYLYLNNPVDAVSRIDDYVEIAELIEDRQGPFWTRTALSFPKYRHWGDATIMDRHLGFIPGTSMGYDPSYLMKDDIENHVPFTGEKKREWFHATVVPHDKRLRPMKTTWPIAWYGPKKLKAPVLSTEGEVLAKNGEYWGSLGVKYMSDGAGWWRRRYAFSAVAGSVYYGHNEEMQQELGPAYQFTPKEIEHATDDELYRISQAQKHRFFTGFDMSYQASVDELWKILEAANQKAGVLV